MYLQPHFLFTLTYIIILSTIPIELTGIGSAIFLENYHGYHRLITNSNILICEY